MCFNPDISMRFLSILKKKLHFQEKLLKHFILQSFLMNIPVTRCSTHKHLGMYLDEKLKLSHHITEQIAKATKSWCYQKITQCSST